MIQQPAQPLVHSALLIPTLTEIETLWRGPIPSHLRPFLRRVHEGLGRLLDHEGEERS